MLVRRFSEFESYALDRIDTIEKNGLCFDDVQGEVAGDVIGLLQVRSHTICLSFSVLLLDLQVLLFLRPPSRGRLNFDVLDDAAALRLYCSSVHGEVQRRLREKVAKLFFEMVDPVTVLGFPIPELTDPSRSAMVAV